jgi:hypothetical protein
MRAPAWLEAFVLKKYDLTPKAIAARTAMTMMIFNIFFISIRKIETLIFYYSNFDDLGAHKVANFLA